MRAARGRARRLDEHGELHHRLSGDREPDARGGGRGAGPGARRALLRPPARRASSRTATPRCSPTSASTACGSRSTTATSSATTGRSSCSRRASSASTRVVRAVRRARHLQRHRPARGARRARTSTGTPTTRRTSPPSGSTRTSRTASCTCGRRSPRATATSRGSAGYNLLNEPADPSGEVVGPFHDRLVAAIREIDRDHIVFVDGNTYSTDFSMFAEPYENAVYACHDYARAGHGLRRPVSGRDPGPVDRPRLPRGEVPRAHRATSARPARRSGSASSARSTRATPSATSSATRSSPTSSTSTTATGPAGRSGPTRTSGCRGSSTPRPTARTWSASAPSIEKKARLGDRLVGVDRPGGARGRRARPRAHRARVPGLVALPVEPARDDRRPRAPHPLRPGDAPRVRRALPRPRRRRRSTSWRTRSPSHGA